MGLKKIFFALMAMAVGVGLTLMLGCDGANPGDGGSYESVMIGSQKWMKRNLNIATADSWCYDNDPSNCKIYGRLYKWTAAMTACPAGWHLPSAEEWGTLMDYAGGWEVAGKALKSTSGWYDNGNGTDAYGFSALPGGSGSSGSKAGYWGNWWAAAEHDSYAYYLYIHYSSDYLEDDFYIKGIGFSVRCVGD